jgi:DNA-binding beta-propeller fold protein YncE
MASRRTASRRSVLAVAAVLLLRACGGSDPEAGTSTPSATQGSPPQLEELARVSVGGEPIGIASGFDSVWVVNSEFDSGGEPSVSRIDPTESAVVATIPVGSVPLEVAVAFDSVWVSNSEDDTVSRIDPRDERDHGHDRRVRSPRGDGGR